MVEQCAGYVGKAVRRREDARLLRGQGLFVADVRLPGLAHAAILRSPYAHARVRGVDLRQAAEQSGVLAALSYAELGEGTPKLPNLVPHKLLRPAMPYPLARDKVHYAGEPVAVVVAEVLYQAEDALEAIEVDYEELPPVADAEAALAPGAPLIHEDLDSNLCASMSQTVGDPDRAFAEADLVLTFPFRFGRASGQPLETRGAVGWCQRSRLGESFTLWSATQMPHNARRVLASLLDVPQQAVR